MMSLSVSRTRLYGLIFPFFLIVFPVLVDIAYGALGGTGRAGLFSVGVLFRGSLAVLGFYLVLRSRASPLKVFLFVFFVIFLVSNIVWVMASDVYSLAHELTQGMKVAYPWLIAGIFLYLDRHVPIEPYRVISLMAWAGFVSALSVIATTALGIGNQTYGDYSYGSKGFFNAQNDIGLVLVITLAAAVVVLVRARKPAYLIVPGAIAGAGLLLGTRAGVLGPAAVVLGFAAAAILNRRMFSPPAGVRNWKATAVLIAPLLVTLVTGMTVFSNAEKTSHLTNKMATLTEETPRSKLEAGGAERLRDRDPILTVFGEGGLAFKKHVGEILDKGLYKVDLGAAAGLGESRKLDFRVHRVENDLYDVLGFYGVLQFAVVYGGLGLVYLLAIRRAFRAWNLENVALLLILTLYLGHSSLAGHGVFSAQVGSMIAPVIFLQLKDLKWGRPRKAATAASGGAGNIRETPSA